jgi:hypothetical protein
VQLRADDLSADNIGLDDRDQREIPHSATEIAAPLCLLQNLFEQETGRGLGSVRRQPCTQDHTLR